MADYVLSCCSTADLSEEHFTDRNISYICFHFELDGKQYPDDLGKSIPFDKFYTAMANGADTKTSQINANEFETYFEPFLQQGKDILHVTLSSGISGVLNSACLARDVLSEKYPERKILIVDSLAASSGYGLLMDKLADLRDEGSGIDEVYQWCLDNRLHVHHWFFRRAKGNICRWNIVSRGRRVGNFSRNWKRYAAKDNAPSMKRTHLVRSN